MRHEGDVPKFWLYSKLTYNNRGESEKNDVPLSGNWNPLWAASPFPAMSRGGSADGRFIGKPLRGLVLFRGLPQVDAVAPTGGYISGTPNGVRMGAGARQGIRSGQAARGDARPPFLIRGSFLRPPRLRASA